MKTVSAAFIILIGLASAALAQVSVVSVATNIPSYAASSSSIANTSTGNFWCITGSATKGVYINVIRINASATVAALVGISVNKYSTAASGGTGVEVTKVPLNSANAGATATVTSYTASPTAGTLVGMLTNQKIGVVAVGGTAISNDAVFEWGINSDQALMLNGTSEQVCVTAINALGAGGAWTVYMKWTEQ